MSLCVMLQSKVAILIASDTAYSVKIGEEIYRVSNDGRKLFQFWNEVMFCSGTIEYVNALIPLVEMNGTRINKTKLRDSVEKLVPKDIRVKLGEPAHLEIIIAGIENGESYICEMREANDYKIVNFVADQEGTRIVTAGLKEAECNGIAYMEFFKSPRNYHDFYVNTYKRMACEEIGGKIDAYLISETGVDKVISHYDLYDGYKIAKDQPWYNALIETGIFQEMEGLKDKPIVHAIVTAWANSTFGPWVVGDLSIYRGSNNHATQGGMYFGVAGLSVSNQFVVDANGYLTATGANISGTINANGGTIGGWRISDAKICAGDGTTDAPVSVMQRYIKDDNQFVFAAGGSSHDSYKDCPFRVRYDGKLWGKEIVSYDTFTLYDSTEGKERRALTNNFLDQKALVVGDGFSFVNLGGLSGTICINGVGDGGSCRFYVYSSDENAVPVECLGVFTDSTSPLLRSPATYARTYTGAVNMHITSSGTFGRVSSSSRRYKHDINNLDIKVIDKLYSLPVRTFKYNDDYLSRDSERYKKIFLDLLLKNLTRFCL